MSSLTMFETLDTSKLIQFGNELSARCKWSESNCWSINVTAGRHA